MARQTGIKGNQAAMRGMKTRSPRASKGTANSHQQTSARDRAIKAEWQRGMNQINAELRRAENRRKFSTRADVEKRARADAAAGKIPKGQLGKTVERRWKEAKKRREKFETAQKATRAEKEKGHRSHLPHAEG